MYRFTTTDCTFLYLWCIRCCSLGSTDSAYMMNWEYNVKLYCISSLNYFLQMNCRVVFCTLFERDLFTVIIPAVIIIIITVTIPVNFHCVVNICAALWRKLFSLLICNILLSIFLCCFISMIENERLYQLFTSEKESKGNCFMKLVALASLFLTRIILLHFAPFLCLLLV